MNNAIALSNVGTGVAVAGGILLVGGVVLFLAAPHDVVVTPTATAESAGLAVVGRF